MSKKNITLKEIKLLWGKSGHKCAICKRNLIQEKKEGNNYPIGEMAHIEGKKPNSVRYNPNMIDRDRNSYGNLILLCPTCHTTIDNDPKEYTVDKLKQIKRDHEKFVEESLKTHMPNVTFAELEVIGRYLMATSILENKSSLTVIPPKEKIERNNLSIEVENLITIGILQVKQVKDYLNKNPDIQFAERLKAGFVKKYRELRDGGLVSDGLFYALWDFASNNSPNFKIKAAGLSVLTYFFELCEVFEK